MTQPDGPPGSPRGLIDAADLRERQQRSRAKIEAFQARALEAKATLDATTTTVTSSDRSVVLTVNPAGTLTDLTFNAPASKLPLPVLARTILATYRTATLEAVGTTESMMRDLLGDDAPLLDIVRASVPAAEENR